MIHSVYDAKPSDFFILLKPRVMSLVIFTALCGMLLAPGSIHPVLGFCALLCIATGAGASGCLNMWCEVHRDAHMARTRTRPLPDGRIDPDSALAFGCILSLLSVCLLGLCTNWYAAFLLFFTILFYIFIYTLYLKPRTSQNIVIGGVAGALPPVIGWVAVTGTTDIAPWLMFLIIFLWTPAHFWSLCIDQYSDYHNAGFPMLPITHGEDITRRGILRYTILTVLASLALNYYFDFGYLYLTSSVILGILFITESYRVYYKKISSRRLFFFSIIYLFLLFLTMIIDHFIVRYSL